MNKKLETIIENEFDCLINDLGCLMGDEWKAESIKKVVNQAFSLNGVGCSFTFEEVEKLLKTQRENCVVAVMKYVTDDEILEKISNAPMYDYKKLKTKK